MTKMFIFNNKLNEKQNSNTCYTYVYVGIYKYSLNDFSYT